jgi:uncharacterized glyoxalase superfamily protein PhnB
MKLTAIRPMLWTENLTETVEFYTRVLGFTCSDINESSGWATIFRDNIVIMLARPNEQTKYDEIGFTGSFYFNTDDVESLWNDVKDVAKIGYDIQTFDWGMREFAIYDNNGYVLQFGQTI